MRKTTILNLITLLVLTFALGCATTGSTVRSGVGDTYLGEAPWYAGAGVIDLGPIAHAPIVYQRGATHGEMFDLSNARGSAVHALITEMNAYLDSLMVTTALRKELHAMGTPPDVQFGCERPGLVDCEAAPDYRLRLAVARPSRPWIDSMRAAAANAGAQRVLVITLETGNYWPEQKNLRGDKRVQLGTGYTVDVPWLTALDKPVSVLQLTGALVDTTGRAVRIGAEGLLAKRTNIALSGFGVQAMISDEDVERVRATRRKDIRGEPLVWQVALRNMVAQLAGRPELTTR